MTQEDRPADWFRAIRGLPIHPLLIGLYPVLGLFAHNIEEISTRAPLRAVLVSLAGVVLLYLLAYLLLKNLHQAAVLTSLLAALFFGYGHVYSLLKGSDLAGLGLPRHRYMALLWIGIAILGWRWVRRWRGEAKLTPILNLAALSLLLLPMLQTVSFGVQVLRAERERAATSTEFTLQVQDPGSLPDIYYIILDAYTRDDTMLSLYEYDNTPFLSALEERGFYVARCSQSNYARTALSLSSSLNMNYLQDFYPREDSSGLSTLVRQSAVRQMLEQIGYTTVSFETTYPRILWEDADHYLTRATHGSAHSEGTRGMNSFEGMLFKTTAGLALLDANLAFGRGLEVVVEDSPKFTRYEMINFTLDKLPDVPFIRGPKLVFAHLGSPHDPYIFSPDGEFVPDQEEFIPGYRDAVRYLNGRLLTVVDALLANSANPPIIILQGDHGGGETQTDFRRMHILNAYYLPEGGASSLYPQITPVNTFRLVFDAYFGGEFGLLQDVSYYSIWTDNFDFTVAPNTRTGCGG